MKILLINTVNNREKNKTGGRILVERNLRVLQKCFGKENIIQYEIEFYKSKMFAFFHSLLGYVGGMTAYYDRAIIEFIREEGIDLCFFTGSFFGKCYRNIKIPIVSFIDNVEFVFFKQRIKNLSFILKVLYIPYQFALYKNEKLCVQQSTLLITLNERNSKEILGLYGRASDIIWPFTLKDTYTIQQEIDFNGNLLLFIGSDFFGNTEGLFWFIENCLDYIDAQLVVIGSGMDRYEGRYTSKNVIFKGFVDSLEYWYQIADAVVLPIISGSGMKTKTAEAMMYGKKIFGTKEAFEGYDFLDKHDDACLCSSKEEFVSQLQYFFQNKHAKYYPKVRECYLQHYSDDCYNELLKMSLSSLLTG